MQLILATDVISTDSLAVPIAALIGAIGTTVIVMGWLNRKFGEIAKRLDAMDARLEDLKRQNEERVLKLQLRLWISELKAANAALEVPDLPTAT